MAGKSKITPTGLFMIHNVSSGATGDYRDMQHQSEVLKTANKSVANAYREKTGMSEAKLLDMMDKETWLSAEDAVKKGFVDEIMFQKNEGLNIYNSTGHMINRDKLQELKQFINSKGKKNGNNQQIAEDNQQEILMAQLELLKLKGESR